MKKANLSLMIFLQNNNFKMIKTVKKINKRLNKRTQKRKMQVDHLR